MTDVFKEQMVKRQTTSKDRLMKVLIIFGVFALFIVLSLLIRIPVIVLLITAAAGYGAYILLNRLNREYEYSFTNGELDIDVIYNKSSRKRVFSGYVKDFEIMAHVEDPSHFNSFNSASERLDYSTGVVTDRSYIFLANYKSQRVAIIIEPNDTMLDAISKVLTRRKFYPKNR